MIRIPAWPKRAIGPSRRLTPRRPVIFMHIPKTGGSALIAEFRAALAPAKFVQGYDQSLFGPFDAFDSLDEVQRGSVFRTAANIPRGAGLVVGHIAFSTLHAAYPSGQFVTILREPISRLLSQWNYLRSRTEDAFAGWGAWAKGVRRAKGSLLAMLSEPMLTGCVDNVATRMLLWPHRLIPNDGLIDRVHDKALLREAMARLRMFSLVDLAESPDRAALRAWSGLQIGQRRENETPAALPDHAVELHAELTSPVLDRLDACSRLDLQLWQRVGLACMGQAALEQLRSRALLCTASRHAALLRGTPRQDGWHAAHAEWSMAAQ